MNRSAPAPVSPGAQAPTDHVIATNDLTKVYPGMDVPAVDRLNLTISAGEIFGLLGPNGAGKTTTAGMLTTRVVPTSGRARIGAVDVVAHPTLAKQLIGVVSQQNTLDRSLSCFENLYFHGLLFGIPARRSRRLADELLEKFQLSGWAKKSVFTLSGGMAQRLMVARSILHRPAVLFLDEPSAGLDPQSRLALWDVLGALNAEGQTIMLLTHYMEEADRLCDRVAIMDHGHILALDTPTALKQSIGADSVVVLRTGGDHARLAQAVRERVPEVTGAHPTDEGVELTVRSGAKGVVQHIIAAAEGYEVADLSVTETTLETVFINLTGRELRDG